MTGQPSRPDWPQPPSDDVELWRLRYRAELQEVAAQRRPAPPPSDTTATERQKVSWEGEKELNHLFHESMLETYRGSLERARNAAELVQKSAGAIGTIYAGLIALAFSVDKNPLPARATIPGIFLGLAIALSTAYMAYRWRPAPANGWQPHSSLPVNQIRRLRFFGRWVAEMTNRRSYALRASVIALGLGVAFLPLPFLSIDEPASVSADLPAPPVIAAGAPEGTAELLALKYEAQLQVAADQREREPATRDTTVNLPLLGDTAVINAVSWSLAILGILAVLLVPRFVGSAPAASPPAAAAAPSAPHDA